MKHNIILSCLLAVIVAPAFIECISVIGPSVLRPHSSYRVAIAGGSRSITLYVAVEGRKSNGEQFVQGREIQVPAAESRLIDLDIADPGPGQYMLVSRSTAGPQFSSSAALVYQPRSFCIFVQTDKRVYQPGDTINFRVIALDKYLLPLTETVDVSVLDAGGSPVREWAALPLDRGIVGADLVLADEPALGEWTIQVEARGQKYSKHILVADYVMPKFKMDLQMPKQILFTEGRFAVNITAKHFNGLPVRGELTISAYAVYFSGLLQPVFSSPARKVIEFDGQSDITYDLKTDLDLAEDAARPLVIEAVLEEKNTLIRQNVSSRILLLRTPYRLKITAPDYFKPTLPYIVQIEVVDPSGSIVSTEGDVTVERLWDDGAPANKTTVTLKKGLATYTLVPDVAHTNSTLNIVITYKDVTERLVNVQKSTATSGNYLTVEMLTRNTSVGGEMRARITATEPMDLLHYAIIGRGDILLAKTLELSPARRSVDVSASVGARMAPGCVLLAWHPRLDNAALLAAAVYAPQARLLQHEVSVTVSGSGRPGGNAELRVVGAGGAHAALLAQDSRAALNGLAQSDGRGSGLTLLEIEREVESFSGLKHSIFKNEDHLPGMGLDLGGNTTNDVFQNAGVVILTDGVVVHGDSEEEVRRGPPETGTRPPLAGPYAFSRVPPPPAPRYYLATTPQPTWTLANFTLGSDGKGVETRRTPAVSGEWLVGAFAVHPTLGLGVAPPQRLTTSTPLSLSAELPATLQQGEMLAAIVTVSTTLNVDTSIELTFHNSEQYFEFEPLENSVDSSKKIELYRRLSLLVPAKGAASTAFLVTVVKTGAAPIIVEATGNGLSASLFRTINVQDGYEEELETWSVLDARRVASRGNLTLEVAAGTRLGAISLLGAGDLLAGVLQAARQHSEPTPAADAVQALRPLAVSCVLLDYLQATGRDEVAVISEARAMASAGFQRLMAFRQPDGSFATKHGDDAEGDIWMSSVAARWLSRCARHVPASPRAGVGAARWVERAQRPDGGWDAPPPLRRYDPRAQAPLALAAHALIALLQPQGGDVLHRNAINKAMDFVSRGVPEAPDAYTLALCAAALAAARHPHASNALQLMDKYANTTSTTLFWSRRLSGSEWRNPWLRGNSVSAATAAFALRAMLAARLLDEAAPVARYLVSASRHDNPDPELLDSLAQYAEMTKSSVKLRVSVNVTGSEETRQFNIDDDNALIVQSIPIRGGRSVQYATEGRGVALAGLRARARTNVTAAWPRYTLDPRVDYVSTADRLQLSICIGFVAQGNETESGLALLTVQLPSGYIADINTITELMAASHVRGARLSAGGSRVVAWVRPRLSERCATLAAPRALPTARQRPGYATIQDLYDSSHRARVFFQPVSSHACDVCREWDSCSRACGSAALQRSGQNSDPRDPRTFRTTPSPDDATIARPLTLTTTIATAAILLLMR